MAVVRGALERAQSAVSLHVVEGVLEGLVVVPWLVAGILVQVAFGPGWPWAALAVILLPRALRVGWSVGAKRDFGVIPTSLMVVQLGALFLAAATAMSITLGFMGVGIQPPTSEFGGDLSASRSYIASSAWLMITLGIVVSLITAIWLAMATWAARSGQRYRAVGWSEVMS